MDLKTALQTPWSDMLKLIGVPAIVTLFAFTYNVGFLSAYDIGWFPFFTLTEHLLFAVRALPLVIAGVIIFVTFVHSPKLSINHTWLFWTWIVVLIAASLLALITNHIALSAILIFMIWIVSVQHEKPTLDTPLNVLYWMANLMVLSMVAGFISGYSWRAFSVWTFWTPWMKIQLVNPIKGLENTAIIGHPMFAGEKIVLFYRQDKGAILLQRSDIAYIQECPRTFFPSECDEAQHKP